MINACLSGVMSSMPPEFCWKKGADFGEIPKGCPKDFPNRIMALCYK